MPSDIPLIALLSIATLLPFLIACGTCYIKFSIVFMIVRNALGMQQVPSNITLNGIALILALYVMMPVMQSAYEHYQTDVVSFNDAASLAAFMEDGLGDYKSYLVKYSDPSLVSFFEDVQRKNGGAQQVTGEQASITSLLPSYALTEITSAFRIGFYIYLPFIVIDLVVSSVLLSLGMMMMSPVTIATPIKLVLFVVLDGWSLLSKGLILQYMDLVK
ncbi:TPA: EscR/YscR/HrcR family type III secretion system export apparatus protein [Salmonella enterica]|nr:EscR/YscR/HrcR family type III secretion system export apparatus protein [Salmonella enterica subsp. diarizonae]HEA0263511.1 EscR/YscR/HrcR family type III secretion system export apparatus protein [Salmonella enterica]HEA0268606.1 EscR/YscR/HrcR family type III secretion system export apparatus protein [Salmonella enterica]HEA0295543.1 EscR/YscR/HrcR family type III secretion system export apparatus protein [Salmonella enterica]HEA0304652.1 EscR/YscR/HrcR family type III secretion system ex